MKSRIDKIFLVGDPGVGKTTALMKAVNILKAKGLTVGGVVSREARSGRSRVGFKIIDLGTGVVGTLASIDQPAGPRVGRYRVNLRDVAEVGAKAILRAIESADVVVCDEVGPMELFSPDFRRAVKALLDSDKPVLGVVHKWYRDPMVSDLKSLPNVEVVEVTYENRDDLPGELAERILKIAGGDG